MNVCQRHRKVAKVIGSRVLNSVDVVSPSGNLIGFPLARSTSGKSDVFGTRAVQQAPVEAPFTRRDHLDVMSGSASYHLYGTDAGRCARGETLSPLDSAKSRLNVRFSRFLESGRYARRQTLSVAVPAETQVSAGFWKAHSSNRLPTDPEFPADRGYCFSSRPHHLADRF